MCRLGYKDGQLFPKLCSEHGVIAFDIITSGSIWLQNVYVECAESVSIEIINFMRIKLHTNSDYTCRTNLLCGFYFALSTFVNLLQIMPLLRLFFIRMDDIQPKLYATLLNRGALMVWYPIVEAIYCVIVWCHIWTIKFSVSNANIKTQYGGAAPINGLIVQLISVCSHCEYIHNQMQ